MPDGGVPPERRRPGVALDLRSGRQTVRLHRARRGRALSLRDEAVLPDGDDSGGDDGGENRGYADAQDRAPADASDRLALDSCQSALRASSKGARGGETREDRPPRIQAAIRLRVRRRDKADRRAHGHHGGPCGDAPDVGRGLAREVRARRMARGSCRRVRRPVVREGRSNGRHGDEGPHPRSLRPSEQQRSYDPERRARHRIQNAGPEAIRRQGDAPPHCGASRLLPTRAGAVGLVLERMGAREVDGRTATRSDFGHAARWGWAARNRTRARAHSEGDGARGNARRARRRRLRSRNAEGEEAQGVPRSHGRPCRTLCRKGRARSEPGDVSARRAQVLHPRAADPRRSVPEGTGQDRIR